jgi:hypothetical protein
MVRGPEQISDWYYDSSGILFARIRAWMASIIYTGNNRKATVSLKKVKMKMVRVTSTWKINSPHHLPRYQYPIPGRKKFRIAAAVGFFLFCGLRRSPRGIW